MTIKYNRLVTYVCLIGITLYIANTYKSPKDARNIVNISNIPNSVTNYSSADANKINETYNLVSSTTNSSLAKSPVATSSLVTIKKDPGIIRSLILDSRIMTPDWAITNIELGEGVTFSGVADGELESSYIYEWRVGDCKSGEIISGKPSFTKKDWSLGKHVIYFRAKDQYRSWTETCQSRVVEVSKPEINTIQKHTKFPSWMKWGVFVGWQADAMNRFESLTGKKPQMEVLFAHWGNDEFPKGYESRIKDKGRTLVIFWEAVDYNRDYNNQPEYSFDSVLSGNMDEYFTKFAADAKAYGGEIYLAPYSEFNGNWFPWSITLPGNNPDKMIRSWKHIHSFFEDVPNVKFAWVPNNGSVPNTKENDFELAYPGNKYVDIVGVDGFNDMSAGTYDNFDMMMATAINKLKKYNKPIYVLSMSSMQGKDKAAWITKTFTEDMYKYPELKGWIWFNENKEQDWRINSDPDSLRAFIDILP